MTLTVHRSHKTERLAEGLFAALASSEGSLFEVPWLVVQGRGMERWIAREGARRHKVFAGVESLHVRSFVRRVTDAVLGPADAEVASSGELVFRVLRHLDDVAASPEGAPFARYLGAHPDAERRMQLAERLADLLDKYLVHRPHVLAAWERGDFAVDGGDDERAQAALFRAIGVFAPMHEARRVRLAIDALTRGEVAQPSKIPPRIFLFGVGTLAPLHLALTRAVASVREVHLSLLAPSSEWMSDLSGEERARGEIGSVVRGLGKLSAEFQRMLADLDDAADAFVDDFDDAPPATALATLQHDVRTLTTRGDGGLPRATVRDDDRSFVVHACHSPLRELEVLRDEIAARLDADPTLRADEIAVLMIDVDRYAPFVHAVFGREEGSRSIPYHLADRGARRQSGYADAFFAALESFDERLSLASFAGLLEDGVVRHRFGIEEGDVAEILEVLRRAGARSGLDADERERLHQGVFSEPTFEHALDRLVLGFATGSLDGLYGEVAPLGGRLAFDAERLGALLDLVEALGTLRRAHRGEGRAAELLDFARKVARTWLPNDSDYADDSESVLRAIDALDADARAAGYDGTMTMASLARLLLARLEDGLAGGDFLRGGITFCRHVPMRAIPFRVIAMLGLDDASFPRRTEPPSFDLSRRKPELGDRTPRDDDRQAFLEALLSARDALWVFYIGRSIADDAKEPVLASVALVLDVLDRTLVAKDGGAPRFVLEHKLHAFDPAYFVRESPFARGSRRAFEAALAATGERDAARVVLSAGTDAERPGKVVVALDEIVDLVERPAYSFLMRTLRASAGDDALVLDEREPIEAEARDGYALRARCLSLYESGFSREDMLRRVRAEGLLPPGTLGELAFERAFAFAESSFALLPASAPMPPKPFDIDLGDGVHLVGSLSDLHADGQRVRIASRIAQKRFTLFVRHLVLEWLAHCGDVPGVARHTAGAGREASGDEVERFDVPRANVAPDSCLRVLARAAIASRTAPQLVHPELLDAAVKHAKESGGWAAAAEAAAKVLEEKMTPRDDSRPSPVFGRAEWRRLLGRALASAGGIDETHLGASFVEVAKEVYAPFAVALKEAQG